MTDNTANQLEENLLNTEIKKLDADFKPLTIDGDDPMVTFTSVSNLAESIVASGLPMQPEYDALAFLDAVLELEAQIKSGEYLNNRHYQRAVKLANNPTGSGHCTYLAGITVAYNVTGSQAWWMQMERYHFNQIVSSQSKMHRLKAMSLKRCCHGKTDSLSITSANEIQFAVVNNKADEERLIYSCPMGLLLTARCVTNYLQLKTIYGQRKNHKLQEWHNFCNWIENLPLAHLITAKGGKGGQE